MEYDNMAKNDNMGEVIELAVAVTNEGLSKAQLRHALNVLELATPDTLVGDLRGAVEALLGPGPKTHKRRKGRKSGRGPGRPRKDEA